MKYTKEDYFELIRLVDEFLDGDDSPEAVRLRHEIRLNAKVNFFREFAQEFLEICSKDEDCVK